MQNVNDDVKLLIWDKCIFSIYNTCKEAYNKYSNFRNKIYNMFITWKVISKFKINKEYKLFYKYLILDKNLIDENFFYNNNVPCFIYKNNDILIVRLRRYSDEDII
jgi:hypothetical protein